MKLRTVARRFLGVGEPTFSNFSLGLTSAFVTLLIPGDNTLEQKDRHFHYAFCTDLVWGGKSFY